MARAHDDTESEEDQDGDWEPGTAGRTDGRAKGAQTDRAKENGTQKKHKKKATADASKDGTRGKKHINGTGTF